LANIKSFRLSGLAQKQLVLFATFSL